MQAAEYRSDKEKAHRAKLAQEQAELDAIHKKEAEEEVCCFAPSGCCLDVCCLCWKPCSTSILLLFFISYM